MDVRAAMDVVMEATVDMAHSEVPMEVTTLTSGLEDLSQMNTYLLVKFVT